MAEELWVLKPENLDSEGVLGGATGAVGGVAAGVAQLWTSGRLEAQLLWLPEAPRHAHSGLKGHSQGWLWPCLSLC